jgi:inosine-uridine nucleoside N-ribohydrolase
MKKFLDTAGRSDIPVFMGGIAPYTIVPHRVHIDEREFGDINTEQLKNISPSTGFRKLGLSGNLDTAAEYLSSLNEDFDIIVGGPMTDLARLIRNYPSLARRIRSIHAQFGMFGFGEQGLMEFGETPRGKKQFNVACDPKAANWVLMNFSGVVYLYPSDVTRLKAIGFTNPEELRKQLQDTPGARELIRLYHVAYELMVKPRGEKIYIHDLAPLFGYLDMYPYAQQDEIEDRGDHLHRWLYKFKSVEVSYVPSLPKEKNRWGEIEIQTNRGRNAPIRYVATEVSPERYLREVHTLVA